VHKLYITSRAFVYRTVSANVRWLGSKMEWRRWISWNRMKARRQKGS